MPATMAAKTSWKAISQESGFHGVVGPGVLTYLRQAEDGAEKPCQDHLVGCVDLELLRNFGWKT